MIAAWLVFAAPIAAFAFLAGAVLGWVAFIVCAVIAVVMLGLAWAVDAIIYGGRADS